MNTSEIETILRHPPQPKPPLDLKEKLKAQAFAATREPVTKPLPLSSEWRSWFARWWPALVPGAASLACAAVISVQQSEIRQLKSSRQVEPMESASTVEPSMTEKNASIPKATTAEEVASQEAEITRLNSLAAKLRGEISSLEQAAKANAIGQARSSDGADTLTREELSAMEQARDKAAAIVCVNNLKQLGLAARVWALDHGDTNPSNVLDM